MRPALPWLINEDRAVKAKLQGLSVIDANASDGRPVPVRYRVPEVELAQQTFPLIVIEHAGIEKDDEREHRGPVRLPYAPEGKQGWWADGATSYDVADSPYLVDYPIPYELRYRVLVFSRTYWHDVALASALAQPDRIPARFGFLEIPEDGTVRRLDLLGGPEMADTRDENGKRLFRREYVISVSSEMLPSVADAYVQAQSVALDFEYFTDHVIRP
ncbi:hypothetical protein [Streptomyces sp. NPDC002088]|uniref:hypothetical protein n=1 Tax=Streptomyces sp. NPDC002088 TaxID=3154665 RepID=UPI00331F14AA